ncbi:hypothetical protein [Bacillus sp. FJAT-42376]|uniref:hypothetical protein n=1 Tax=Bacillus sp. FJAT-42376 TaxID=2014076 RepID=UPI000F4F83CB|nr:hypothetical protein [Bacillus sp. FJAT-42376]
MFYENIHTFRVESGKELWKLEFLTVLRNIFFTFFQNGIWAVGFFYLLNLAFPDKRIRDVSKIALAVVLIIYLLYSIAVSI